MTQQRLTETARGVYIISATPFTDEGEIDFKSVDRLVDFYLEKQVDGITILGMMGEAPKLSPGESLTFAGHVLKRLEGALPVIVGASGSGFDGMKGFTHEVMSLGAAGVMVAPNATLKTEQAIVNYYHALCGHLGPEVPIVYQDFPLSTQAHISASCFNRLTAELDQIVMLKHEDWPGLNKLSAIRRGAEEQGLRRVSILTGNGGIFLPQELARGADGAMTGFAYPELLVSVCRLFDANKRDEAEDLYEAYLPLIRYEQQPGFGLAARKEILRRRGVIASARTRAPGPAMSLEDHEELTRMLSRLEKRLEELGA